MTNFSTKQLPITHDDVAPDGSNVRRLLATKQGGMAHFELPPGQTSIAMTHRTVEEIWFFLSGHGEMWRKNSQQETIVQVKPNTCLTLPLGTHFQFRALSQAPLTALGVTMPPWPGDTEAVEVQGIWRPTIS